MDYTKTNWVNDTDPAINQTNLNKIEQGIEKNSLALKTGWNDISGLGTFLYDSADAPTFVIATSNDLTGILSVGMKLRLTQTTAKYFFITAIDSTTITVYGGTDYTLVDATITNPSYSTEKAPYGFPMNPDKWSVIFESASDFTVNGSGNIFYLLDPTLKIDVPVGVWDISYVATVYVQSSVNTVQVKIISALSTSTTSASNEKLKDNYYYYDNVSNIKRCACRQDANDIIVAENKTPYYLIVSMQNTGTLDIRGAADADTVIRATISYL